MTKNFIDTLSAQNTGIVDTIQKLNQLAVANVEKLTALQMANLQAYSEIGIDQLKTLGEIKNAEDVQGYVGKQVEVLKKINERLVTDTKELVKLNTAFNTELQKLARDSLNTMMHKAA